MVRGHLEEERVYNERNFENDWTNLKIRIIIGVFFNVFRKHDIMNDILSA